MKRITMSGCYDVFHDGHRHILRSAAKLVSKGGEVLVCMNTDESVRRLKGDGRPVNDLTKRMSDVLKFATEEGLPLSVTTFSTEEELAKAYDDFNSEAILHGDDIKDITKVTGYPKRPVIIVDRGFDSNGERTSSTRLIEENNA